MSSRKANRRSPSINRFWIAVNALCWPELKSKSMRGSPFPPLLPTCTTHSHPDLVDRAYWKGEVAASTSLVTPNFLGTQRGFRPWLDSHRQRCHSFVHQNKWDGTLLSRRKSRMLTSGRIAKIENTKVRETQDRIGIVRPGDSSEEVRT